MSSLLDISSESENYFINNWIDTPIQFKDKTFDYKGIITWIALGVSPVDLKQIGMNGTTTGRELMTALFHVFCYNTSYITVISLSDNVKEFFSGTELPLDIRVNFAQYNPPILLDNGFWEIKLNFEITQYS